MCLTTCLTPLALQSRRPAETAPTRAAAEAFDAGELDLRLRGERVSRLMCFETPQVFWLEPDSETNRSDSETRVLKLGF